MRIEYDPAGVAAAASRLAAGADLALGVSAVLSGLTVGVVDAALREALCTLGDVSADVLDVVALDLDLLAGLVDVGASHYESVEAVVGRAVTGADPPS